MGYEVLHEDLDTAWKRVAAMKYISDGGSDNLKSPTEFFRDGGGDCADFAGTLIYLLGPEAEMVEVLNDSGIKHALVLYNKLYLDPQIYGLYLNKETIQILNIYTYNDVVKLSTDYGRKSL
jgi:hypothetical protein